ncbi:hypothetical protein BOTCAL_0391g00120 [Botryotinia calthae]|uniref:Uncharacterized protein n=1 Tax=Botryotinia calthae TaxID=38488 RepID=A0A4Y8CTK9_9HELO|nr:hypothetical protein BOTCAL_0391g00120 [Botryotinia calthae]
MSTMQTGAVPPGKLGINDAFPRELCYGCGCSTGEYECKSTDLATRISARYDEFVMIVPGSTMKVPNYVKGEWEDNVKWKDVHSRRLAGWR